MTLSTSYRSSRLFLPARCLTTARRLTKKTGIRLVLARQVDWPPRGSRLPERLQCREGYGNGVGVTAICKFRSPNRRNWCLSWFNAEKKIVVMVVSPASWLYSGSCLVRNGQAKKSGAFPGARVDHVIWLIEALSKLLVSTSTPKV